MKKLGTTLIAIAAAVGVAGPAMAANPGTNTNTLAYWESTLGIDCDKWEVNYDGLREFTPAAGFYGYIIVKGGNGYIRYDPGTPGPYQAPVNASGKAADISWVITCETGYPS